MVSALFVRKDSIYKTLNIDCWDIDRNASLYNLNNAVICHPPCRLFGRLAHMSTAHNDEKQLAYKSVEFVRKYGGIIEHPSGSKLWKECNLPLNGNCDEYGGFTISINQYWFGHLAEKKTWLYICGISKSDLPQIPLNFNAIQYVVSSSKTNKKYNGKKEISKADREHTPLNFAVWLIQVATLCYIFKNKP